MPVDGLSSFWLPEDLGQLRFAAPYHRAIACLPIRCVETHISRVFLTGPYAYKVKKPVKLSFVDYSTAARRAACCREELRLNRRYAPGLYLDVVPIGGSATQMICL